MKCYLACFLYLASFAIILISWFFDLHVRFVNQSTHPVLELGRITGLVGAWCLLVQVVLFSRIPWIESAFGLDRLSRFHRVNGFAAFLFILAHPVFLTIGYGLRDSNPFWDQFVKFLSWSYVFLALIAFLLFFVIIFSSVVIIRKHLKYETWYSIHLTAYAAILLTFAHQVAAGSDLSDSRIFRYYWYFIYLFTFGSLLIYRFAKPIYQSVYHGFYVEKVGRETEDVASVYIRGKNLKCFSVAPGQFMVLRFLSKALWLQAHPVSLSFFPDGESLRFTIKNVGDFTAQVSGIPHRTFVLIEGPYGVFTASRCKNDKILMIAGGIGITPIRSLSEQLAKMGRNISVLYSSRKMASTALAPELDHLAAVMPNFKIQYVISDDPAWKGLKGKLTKEMLQNLVPDVPSRDIFLCGPPLMMRATIANLRSLGVPKAQIHYELFSL